MVLALLDPVAREPSSLHVLPILKDRWHARGKRELNNRPALIDEHAVWRDDDRLRPPFGQPVERGHELVGRAACSTSSAMPRARVAASTC